MATVVTGDKVKLSNGQIVTAQQGGWYDGQQFWGGSLSSPGQINAQSNQVGAGQQVSNEVIAQTNPANVKYIQQQQQTYNAPAPTMVNANPQAPSANQQAPAGSGEGVGYTPPAPAINLPEIYKNLYDTSGISALEKEMSDKITAYNDAQMKINDNPFLAEANRVGRIQKLSTDFDNRVANLQRDVATKKADIEMQLNLQTKQFDINSTVAQQNLQQFQMLLQAGALDNASGTDIANITRSTGLSSNMITSAIQAQKQKNIQTQVISYDDGENQGFAVINPQTGEIIKQQVVAQSKSANDGNGSGILNENRQIEQDQKLAPQYATTAAKQGKTLSDMMSTFQSYGMTIQSIWDIYKAIDYYHMTDAQRKADMKKWNVK